jgi:hypothetical protein
MSFNISEFNAEISKTGIAAPSHFEGLIMSGPGSMAGGGSGTSILTALGLDQGMRFRIESLNMPGRTLTTLDQQYHGPVRAIPYRFTVQPVTITVILSRDMRERELFMRWQDYFIGHYRTNYRGINSPGMFDTKYYDDGIGEMHIWQWGYPVDATGDNVEPIVQNEIKLMECYPLSVNDIAMSWNDEGYSKLQVEMKYRFAIERNISFENDSAFVQESNNKAGYYWNNNGSY